MFRYLVAIVLIVAVVASPALAQSTDLFMVTIPVDVTAETASAARETAHAQGQKDALSVLLKRLTLMADASKLPDLSPEQVAKLVQGIEIAEEKNSRVRYLARLTVRFRPESVRNLLKETKIAFAETQSKPVVIIPVYETEKLRALWEETNVWKQIWAGRDLAAGLVPMVLPLGDLEDVARIDANRALKGDKEALMTLAQRYNTEDAVVARAFLTTDKEKNIPIVELDITRFSPSSDGTQLTVDSIEATEGETTEQLLARAVDRVIQNVSDVWKRENLLNFDESSTLEATTSFDSLQEWVAVRRLLEDVPVVRRIELLALTRQAAIINLEFLGGNNQLISSLAQRDLNLKYTDKGWVLKFTGTLEEPMAVEEPPTEAEALPVTDEDKENPEEQQEGTP